MGLEGVSVSDDLPSRHRSQSHLELSKRRVLKAAILAALCCFYGGVTLGQTSEKSNSIAGVWNNLADEKKLSIGYFGGSITEGAGATDGSKTSWRALTTAWFRQQFPQAQITEVNAAIGGTGSELGVFRCSRDLLRRKPDLVFVEFAVNDCGYPESVVLRSMEGIVRQIRADNSATQIIFVYTTAKHVKPVTAALQQKVADHYGLPSIDVGEMLKQEMQDKGASWETLTTDGVHPNDTGHALYATAIADFLSSHRGDTEVTVPTNVEPMAPNPINKAEMIDAWTVDTPGWTREPKSLAGRFPHFISADAPGTTLTFPFTGEAVGVYWMMAPDSGTIQWSIDEGPKREASSWDTYSEKSSRANYAVLATGLPRGPHVLKLEIAPHTAPQSKGTWIRVGAFLVE